MDIIFSRSSVRHYTDQKPEKEKLIKILQAGMAAPSSANQQPWEFIVVEDESIIAQLSAISAYTTPAGRSKAVIIALGNKDRMKYPGNWEQDLGACCENMLLETEYLGLGAVWLGIYPVEEDMQGAINALSLADNLLPYAIIPIGYKKQETTKERTFDMSRVTWL